MEPLKLSEQEQRLFSELFGQSDVENSGKVSGVSAGNLFLTSGLSQELLNQITELCGAKRLGHFGRSQFYIALKLIAAAQRGLPIMLESLTSGQELYLPKFGVQANPDSRWAAGYNQQPDSEAGQNDRKVSLPSSQLPPPPKHQRVQGQRGVMLGQEVAAPVMSTQVSIPQDQPMASPPQSPPTSPAERPPVVDGGIRPPSNSHSMPGAGMASQLSPGGVGLSPGGVGQYDANPHGHEKGWASFEEDNQGLLTNEAKDWAHFTDSSSKQDTSSISSEAESIEDVWSITDEQRDYYINQFKTMQADVRGVISGAIAKEFFEKSRLPTHELSKIWQLSDVNRDGALSLEEFCTAMHLVVLKRNEVELPDHLPPALLPYTPLNPDEPFAADLPPGSTIKKLSPGIPSPTAPGQWMGAYTNRVAESPTSSSVSSPGSKPTPVNFDYKPIIADSESKIVHPVPLRMSPDGHAVPVDAVDGTGKSAGYDGEAGVTSPTLTFTDNLLELEDVTPPSGSHPQQLAAFKAAPVIQGRPRPIPRKAQSISGPSQDVTPSQPLLLPPPSSQEFSITAGDRPTTLPVTGVAEDLAPPPPPRKSGHSRSSSLDNQLIDFTDFSNERMNRSMPPPAVPPRGGLYGEGGDVIPTEKSVTPPGYLKDRPKSRDNLEPYTSTPAKSLVRESCAASRDLRDTIRKQRLQNMTLSRLNNELNEELQEVMEQRIALEIQLEHLRPFHSY